MREGGVGWIVDWPSKVMTAYVYKYMCMCMYVWCPDLQEE